MMYDDSVRGSFRVLTPGDMRRTEQKAFDLGVPSLLLMEHAALAVVDELEKALSGDCKNKSVLFACGTGNNGGDGLAAARLFRMRGGLPTVWLSGAPKTADAQTNLRWLENLQGVEILNLREMEEEQLPFDSAQRLRTYYHAYVDALLGTGLRGAPDELTARMIAAMQSDDAFDPPSPIIAVDIPSGINGLTGETPGAYVCRADVTVTFHAPKPGLYLTKDRNAVGRIAVADIGLWNIGLPGRAHPLSLENPELDCVVFTPRALRFEDRSPECHKGDCGRVLIYAGSMGMAGAAAMCAKAAVTAGAGLTTVACEKEIIPILQTLVPNAMCADIRQAAKNPPACDVLALGCGLGQSEEIWENILKLWSPDKKSVWDADALNLLARHPMKLGKNAVITPHPGEAARLLGISVEGILADRLAAAKNLSEKYGCTAVLKSDVTVICDIDQEDRPEFMLNVMGSPALAKGGSGDALTGILAALLHEASPSRFRYRAALACLWHGMAGIVGEEKYGQRELTTAQLISCLHDARRWGHGEMPPPACYP